MLHSVQYTGLTVTYIAVLEKQCELEPFSTSTCSASRSFLRQSSSDTVLQSQISFMINLFWVPVWMILYLSYLCAVSDFNRWAQWLKTWIFKAAIASIFMIFDHMINAWNDLIVVMNLQRAVTHLCRHEEISGPEHYTLQFVKTSVSFLLSTKQTHRSFTEGSGVYLVELRGLEDAQIPPDHLLIWCIYCWF